MSDVALLWAAAALSVVNIAFMVVMLVLRRQARRLVADFEDLAEEVDRDLATLADAGAALDWYHGGMAGDADAPPAPPQARGPGMTCALGDCD